MQNLINFINKTYLKNQNFNKMAEKPSGSRKNMNQVEVSYKINKEIEL